jgi:CubicO group peptidase (beta-lactamase class C family)
VDERFAPVLREMERQVAEGIRPTIQVAVDWRGERVFDAAVGDGADLESNYVLWSTTKPFVAVALLREIEAGRARLDDRVRRFIPEFGCNGKEACTLAHLLSHRGGFPDAGRRVIDTMRVAWDWDELLRLVCEMPAQWEPGTDRGYHPLTGWVIVGELVQRLTDIPLADAVREGVLDPAGIDPDGFSLGRPETLSGPPLPVRTRDAKGAPGRREADWWNAPETQAALIPGAGGISRAGQVVRFYRTLLDGGTGPGGAMLSPETVRMATFPHAVGILDRTFLTDIPWGLGFHLKHVRPSLDDCGRTATPGTFGHGGHFLVNTAWGDPGKDLAVCILSNGLTEPRLGTRSVGALSQTIHDVVDAEA